MAPFGPRKGHIKPEKLDVKSIKKLFAFCKAHTFAIIFSLISRKQLDYFEGLALVGLILGIFGFVFSITGIILGVVTEGSGYFNFWSLLFDGNLI